VAVLLTPARLLGEDREVTATIHEVLGELRATSLDERDKGDKFERLVMAYLRTDPEWSAKFSDVWLWGDWPGRAGVTDIGIDLVAANRDRDDFTAIQCKFYGPGHKVAKGDIDSFLSASMRPDFGFSQRIVFDTAAGWSGNAEETMQGVAQRVDIGYLDDATIDWSQFRWETPEVIVSTGKKALRPHQARALEDVLKGLGTHNRGKLIMACGTGKTFTSLRIAEELVGEGGSVLFLVPSIQLLSQSLREWMANAEVDIRPFAVCSDVRVGRKVQTDDADMSTIDLTEPATTNATTLVARMSVGKYAKERMTVVFSTYQSIDVLIEAQQQGLADFDLVICDEAHRTTGVTLAGQDESAFVRVHDNDFLRASKRLYMTATPRVFGDAVTKKAQEAGAVLADMNTEKTFGPELHRLGFGDAVEADLLTDYKVLVLAVDEKYVAENFQQAMSESGEMKLDEAAKLIGCWNGLAKNFGNHAEGEDPSPDRPMRTAVAFAQNIKASQKAASAFPTMVDRAIIDLPEDRVALRVEAHHVDGTMGIHERNTHLTWLKDKTPDNVCRILSNAKCLSEGVDVPSLDAVLFLTPRGSQVDVVQSVGRVMRKAPGKELGYIILPVVVPTGIAPEDALRDNERYKVVWQVLQALRSHDDRFHALVNQLELNKKKPTSKLDIIPITTPVEEDVDGSSSEAPERKRQESIQAVLEFPSDQFRDAMYARIVAKVGERRYWETWAKDVADIAARHTSRIKGLLADTESNAAKEFEEFLKGLRGNLNDNVTADEAIEMLAQHLVTRPIFEALFDGYDFAATNPVAKTMELMLVSLDEHNLSSENEKLETFYDSVRRRVAGVDNAEGKQRILVELYDRFFAVAFKKTVDRLGIVYTPVEIVDFILRSADAVMRQEFGQGLTDEGVHILDGFTGTGTFLVRLLQSGLIEPHELARKYAHELHGNEILLLAYYIACVNIEQTYADLAGHEEPFPGLILTDTFQSWEPDDKPDLDVFPENNARLEALKRLPITVILGNPPYSSGQDSANDNNQNEKYPALDDALRRDYMSERKRGGNNAMFDSYIRAIKWASLRITDRGVIAYVTNGGWLDSNTADGMRKALISEFSSIHILNLKGNMRSADWRREGGQIFGAGSQATVAVAVFVKNPSRPSARIIQYSDIGDFLSREDKLARLSAAHSILGMDTIEVVPNEHADWLSQRDAKFGAYLPVGAKHGDDLGGTTIFSTYTRGLETGRDAWVYNSSATRLAANVRATVDAYNSQVRDFQELVTGGTSRKKPKDLVADFIDLDPGRISWTLSLKNRLAARKEAAFEPTHLGVAAYRPFFRQAVYYDSALNHIRGQLPRVFPTPLHDNMGIYQVGMGSALPFGVLMLGSIPDLHVTGAGSGGQFFPRWRYERFEDSGMLDLDGDGDGEVVDSYRRIDNITDMALERFVKAYPSEAVTKDDVFFYVYGLLHSPEYRETYAADLKKMLPRIPMVRDFRAFAEAGRALSDLHLNYESVQPYDLAGLDVEGPGGDAAYGFYAVGSKKMSFGKANAAQKAAGDRYDRSVIRYNDRITVSGIPDEAYRYMLGSRSAIEWIIDRYYVKTDKASGIVNDPNEWSREVADPRYILDLLARVVTVSVETMRIVDGLPALDIIPSP
jgi:predicted helicase